MEKLTMNTDNNKLYVFVLKDLFIYNYLLHFFTDWKRSPYLFEWQHNFFMLQSPKIIFFKTQRIEKPHFCYLKETLHSPFPTKLSCISRSQLQDYICAFLFCRRKFLGKKTCWCPSSSYIKSLQFHNLLTSHLA